MEEDGYQRMSAYCSFFELRLSLPSATCNLTNWIGISRRPATIDNDDGRIMSMVKI